MTNELLAPEGQHEVEVATSRWRSRALLLLALLGGVLSGYLTWVHYSGTLALCAGAGGCEQVQASRFASVAGVPVAVLGLLFYLSIFVLGLWQRRADAESSGTVKLLLFGLTLLGVLYSGYLTYLELFVIGAICPWCVASALIVTALWGISTWELWHA